MTLRACDWAAGVCVCIFFIFFIFLRRESVFVLLYVESILREHWSSFSAPDSQTLSAQEGRLLHLKEVCSVAQMVIAADYNSNLFWNSVAVYFAAFLQKKNLQNACVHSV